MFEALLALVPVIVRRPEKSRAEEERDALEIELKKAWARIAELEAETLVWRERACTAMAQAAQTRVDPLPQQAQYAQAQYAQAQQRQANRAQLAQYARQARAWPPGEQLTQFDPDCCGGSRAGHLIGFRLGPPDGL